MISPYFDKLGKETKTQDRSCRILLVEDNEEDQFLAQKRLEASSQVSDVLCFSDGEGLMDYMKKNGFYDRSVMCLKPTIIVLDLNMPKVNGFEILKKIKSDPFLAELPVLVVSDEASYENVRKAHELGADAFFRKPLNVFKLQSFFHRGWQWPTQDMWMR